MSNNLEGLLYDIQGFSVHDGPGVRTTVFLKGCYLKCLWCHSPESIPTENELNYFEIKCVGHEACGQCLNSCSKGAISLGAMGKDTEGNVIQKIAVDHEKCDNCLECTASCPAKALTSTGYKKTVDEVVRRVCGDKLFFGADGGATISGGEPMKQFEFTLELCKALKEKGISICLDTTGFAPTENYLKILPYVDLFLYDLKHMDSDMHKRLTGVPNELIHKNAKAIAEAGGKFQIRVPVIPKLNDSETNLRAVAEFCKKLGDAVTLIQLLPYHNFGKAKYDRLGKKYKLDNVVPPTDEQMEKHLLMMQEYGLPAQIH